jgi:hypothetical protein
MFDCYKHSWRLAPAEYKGACPSKKVIWQQCHICGKSRNINVEEWLTKKNA